MNTKPPLVVRLLAKSIDLIIFFIFIEFLKTTGFFAGLMYVLIADGLFEGRSIGKYLTHLRVVKKDSSPATTRESIIRNSPLFFALILIKIPFLGLLLGGAIILLELIMLVGSPKTMRLGDELAGTEVVEA